MKFFNLLLDLIMNLLIEWFLRGNCFWIFFNKFIDFCVWLIDESGSDSDGAESISFFYFFFSDYVTDMINSEIDGDILGILLLKCVML